jgi:hypothetical protein
MSREAWAGIVVGVLLALGLAVWLGPRRAAVPRPAAPPAGAPAPRAEAPALPFTPAPRLARPPAPSLPAPAEAPPPPAPASAGGTGVLEILVADDRGLPVEGAKARARSAAGGVEAATDAAGRALVEVAPGAYGVRVEAAGFVDAAEIEDVRVAAGERRTLAVALVREGILRIVVVGGSAGKYWLRVRWTDRDDESGSMQEAVAIDAAGRGEARLEPRRVEACLRTETGAAESPWQALAIEPGAATEATFALAPAPPVVVGRVFAKADGRPIAGAWVQDGRGNRATTDAGGAFVLASSEGVPASVAVGAAGFGRVQLALDVEAQAPLGVTVGLDAGGAIAVEALQDDGAPLADVDVRLLWPEGRGLSSMRTDAAGHARFVDLGAGSYGVAVARERVTVDVRPGEETAVRFALPAK